MSEECGQICSKLKNSQTKMSCHRWKAIVTKSNVIQKKKREKEMEMDEKCQLRERGDSD